MIELFKNLELQVEKGISGEEAGISIGLPNLDRYISVRKGIYTLIFGASGTGKSSLAHNCYILNPFDWWQKNKSHTKIKLKIVYFSMERAASYVTAKWLCRKIFLNEKKLIPLPKLMGWWTQKLTKEEHDLFLQYRPYFQNMEGIVEVIEGVQNPTGIYKWIKEYALKNGKVEEMTEFHKVYVPNDPNLITVIVVDHQSLIKKEKNLNTKKEAIDKLSEYLQHARDFYGFSPVLVAQMNREIGNINNQKLDSFEPVPEQIKDSATSYEDCDVCISLFDSLKYKTKAPTGHDALAMLDQNSGASYYRSLKLHKNTWGEDNLRKGLAFHGAIGHFKELPKLSETTPEIYQQVLNGTYFTKFERTQLIPMSEAINKEKEEFI